MGEQSHSIPFEEFLYCTGTNLMYWGIILAKSEAKVVLEKFSIPRWGEGNMFLSNLKCKLSMSFHLHR